MAKTNNLKDFLTDLYEGISSKKPNASRNPQDFRSEIESISGGGATINVPGDWQGTTVPNNAYVESIYLNTNLTVDEVTLIIQNADLEYNDGMYFIAFREQLVDGVAVPYNAYTILAGGGTVAIIDATDFTVYFHNVKEQGAEEELGFPAGWNPAITYPIAIQTIQVDSMEGGSIGTKNDEISSLVSTTPFTKAQGDIIELQGEYNGGPVMCNIEQGWFGTAVPALGNIEKVYVNTAIPSQDVKNILSTKIGYPATGEWEQWLLFCDDVVLNFIGVKCDENQKWSIFSNNNGTSTILWDEDNGWSFNFTNPIQFNINGVSPEQNGNVSIGLINSELSSLFSTTDFIFHENSHTIYLEEFLKENKLPSRFSINKNYVIPSGSLSISEPGAFDVKEYEYIYVNIPTPEGTIEITENGTHDVTQYAYAEVDVDTKSYINTPSNGVLPNTGYLDKIYINTKLSNLEVKDILKTIRTSYDSSFLNNFYIILHSETEESNNIQSLLISHDYSAYLILIGLDIIYDSREINGWVESNLARYRSEDGSFYVEANLLSSIVDNKLGTVSIGNQNSKLSKLFATSPDYFIFGDDAGQVIEIEGEYEASVLNITENGTHLVKPLIDNKQIPTHIDVNVPIPEGYIKPSGIRYIQSTEAIDVKNYSVAQVYSSTLVSSNIKKGVSVLGVYGTYEGDTPMIKYTNNDGVSVPNNSYVENIYLNTKLSIENVEAILSQVEYDEVNDDYEIFADDNCALVIMKFDDGYAIFLANSNDMTIFYCSSTAGTEYGVDFVGWNELYKDYVLSINSTSINESVGLQNNIISGLISITPFYEEVTLKGEYDGTPISITENTTLDMKSLINEKKIPLRIAVDVEEPYVEVTSEEIQALFN